MPDREEYPAFNREQYPDFVQRVKVAWADDIPSEAEFHLDDPEFLSGLHTGGLLLDRTIKCFHPTKILELLESGDHDAIRLLARQAEVRLKLVDEIWNFV